MTNKKRGGWRNPASAVNGRIGANAQPGRPPKERAITLSEVGPEGATPSVTGTATIGRAIIKIALDDGRKLTIWID
jgi:hypothetical protein